MRPFTAGLFSLAELPRLRPAGLDRRIDKFRTVRYTLFLITNDGEESLMATGKGIFYGFPLPSGREPAAEAAKSCCSPPGWIRSILRERLSPSSCISASSAIWPFLRAELCQDRGRFRQGSAAARPFLTDCNTLYVGSRKNALEHMDAAYFNGFSPFSTGCHVIIADGLQAARDDVRGPGRGRRVL